MRICWSKKLLENRLAELEEDLVERGYKRRSIRSSFTEVKKIGRVQALRRVERKRGEKDSQIYS